MSLSKVDHCQEAVGKKPIIGMQHFNILTFRRNLLQGEVMIRSHTYKYLIIMNANSGVLARIVLRDLKCTILTTVVDDNVFPITISLSQYTLNALGQIFFAVIDRGQHAHQGLCQTHGVNHRSPTSMQGFSIVPMASALLLCPFVSR